MTEHEEPAQGGVEQVRDHHRDHDRLHPPHRLEGLPHDGEPQERKDSWDRSVHVTGRAGNHVRRLPQDAEQRLGRREQRRARKGENADQQQAALEGARHRR